MLYHACFIRKMILFLRIVSTQKNCAQKCLWRLYHTNQVPVEHVMAITIQQPHCLGNGYCGYCAAFNYCLIITVMNQLPGHQASHSIVNEYDRMFLYLR